MSWRFPQLSGVWSQGFRGFKLSGEKAKRKESHNAQSVHTAHGANKPKRWFVKYPPHLALPAFKAVGFLHRYYGVVEKWTWLYCCSPSESRTDSLNSNSSGVLDSWVCCGLKSDRLEPQRRHVGRTLFIRSAQGEAGELNEISGNTGIWSP